MNDQFLNEAQAAAEAIDISYRQADFASKLKLKPNRDQAFELVASLRQKSVAGALTLTQANLDEMASIRAEVCKAANEQTMLIGGAQLIAALARHLA